MKPKFDSRQMSSAICFLAATLTWTSTTLALADEKPSVGVVELIVPFGTGGGADRLARETAKLLDGVLPAPVKVTNIPGATGNTGIAKLLAAPNDGNTMAVLTADTFSLLAYLNPGWKMSDIVPLAIMLKQPSALFLPANSRFKAWADFEKEARLRPDTLRVAITGLGSPDYLALQQLAAKGIKLAPLPLSNPEERYRAPLKEKPMRCTNSRVISRGLSTPSSSGPSSCSVPRGLRLSRMCQLLKSWVWPTRATSSEPSSSRPGPTRPRSRRCRSRSTRSPQCRNTKAILTRRQRSSTAMFRRKMR